MPNSALFAKALGSASEEEAIACLRMARKKGLTIEDIRENKSSYISMSEYNILVRRFNSLVDKYYSDTKKLKSDMKSTLIKYRILILASIMITSIMWYLNYPSTTACFIF